MRKYLRLRRKVKGGNGVRNGGQEKQGDKIPSDNICNVVWKLDCSYTQNRLKRQQVRRAGKGEQECIESWE